MGCLNKLKTSFELNPATEGKDGTFPFLWPLSPAASSVSWYQSCFVCSGLAYEIYSGGGPATYVYCVVCYCVIAAPYVRSVGHVFTYLYTLDDDSEHPMDY